MSEIHITPEQIRSLASQVNRSAAGLNDTVRILTNAFNSSSGYWRGNARDRFNEAMERWNGSWTQMHASLEEMQRLMEQWVAQAEEIDRSVQLG